ncbi:hypothetical protein A2765_00290 [Candidatus Kaiserbacteria bacterium RIFCSPHIGHO2_01_FULL_56_24]|uniref:Uncharacterized protein n=1 Tax=Candidatus Kaiserbacteria bacterium RIFCSPHIGHO2_01_FULL_56_24 TaxID=1798487 RepID=A0A1F6DFP8_9BACT|nr:MAG: hypothetical protein A2765_00290 [Candidatus Kaiserbacteria bacterium RIFCSPHIGHO2_01_FULL_56_24]
MVPSLTQNVASDSRSEDDGLSDGAAETRGRVPASELSAGGAPNVIDQLPDGDSRVSRRPILKWGAVGILTAVAAIKAQLTWHFFELDKRIPTISDITPGLDDLWGKKDVPSLVVSEKEWIDVEPEIEAAIRARDFQYLSDLTTAVDKPILKRLLHALTYQLNGQTQKGRIGFDTLTGREYISRFPPRARLHLLRWAAWTASADGSPEESLKLWGQLHALKSYKSLSEVARVGLWREELNHLSQTMQSRTEYYDVGARVLGRYDEVLKQCLAKTGNNLDSAVSFDPGVGPAVVSMRFFREFCEAKWKGDRRAMTIALKGQGVALKKLYERDRRLGSIRLSLVASQHIRAGNRDAARDSLAQQEELYREQDSSPPFDNCYEFGINRILKAMVEAYGFREYDRASRLLNEADDAFKRTATKRFRGEVREFRSHLALLGGGVLQKGDKQRVLAGHATTYFYFFGEGTNLRRRQSAA